MSDAKKTCRKKYKETCLCDICKEKHKQKLAWLLRTHKGKKQLKLVVDNTKKIKTFLKNKKYF